MWWRLKQRDNVYNSQDMWEQGFTIQSWFILVQLDDNLLVDVTNMFDT